MHAGSTKTYLYLCISMVIKKSAFDLEFDFDLSLQECDDGNSELPVSGTKRVLRVIKVLRFLKIMRLLKGIKLVELVAPPLADSPFTLAKICFWH